jgi:NitT/TauT family transport system substrate-binding protein
MKRLLISITLTFLLSSASLGWAQLIKLKVAISPIGAYLPVFVGQDKGFFKEMGLEVETLSISGGAKKLEAMAGGSVDIAGSSVPPIIRGASRGFDFMIISPMANNPKKPPIIAGIFVRKDSGINSVKDLPGKKIAIAARGGVDDLATNILVEKAGGDPKKIVWIELRRSAMLPSLVKGVVNGAFLVDPFMSMALREPNVKHLVSPVMETIPGAVLTAFASSKRWLRKNSELAARYSLAIKKGINWINKNEAEARGTIVPKYTRLKKELALKMGWYLHIEHVQVDSLQKVADMMLKYGYLNKAVNAENIVYYTAR